MFDKSASEAGPVSFGERLANSDVFAALFRDGQALAEDFTPLSDFRASREYRLLTAQNLLRRYFIEQQTPHIETRVTAYV